MTVFVVPQVDAEGYVLPDEFVNVVSNWYKEDWLKNSAQSLVPECISEANAYATGRYKAQQIQLQTFPQNLRLQLFHSAPSCIFLSDLHTPNIFSATNCILIKEIDVIF